MEHWVLGLALLAVLAAFALWQWWSRASLDDYGRNYDYWLGSYTSFDQVNRVVLERSDGSAYKVGNAIFKPDDPADPNGWNYTAIVNGKKHVMWKGFGSSQWPKITMRSEDDSRSIDYYLDNWVGWEGTYRHVSGETLTLKFEPGMRLVTVNGKDPEGKPAVNNLVLSLMPNNDGYPVLAYKGVFSSKPLVIQMYGLGKHQHLSVRLGDDKYGKLYNLV